MFGVSILCFTVSLLYVYMLFKQGSGLCKSNISLSVFEQYFNSVNNPESPFFTPDEDILHFIDRYERNEFDIMFHELNLPFSLDEIKRHKATKFK